ncbi:type I-E CRISPR-associated protein Cse2/CasB [Kitasatospora sp. NPDC098663]|uniref:type I-E CRISPR-associated protein Cse2/CasB n=1 Tax=Kitasatospora sp. NPDC098663 TaxID=3364096 RepID=UPI0038003886
MTTTEAEPRRTRAANFVDHITHVITTDPAARRALASGLGHWPSQQPPGPMHQYVAPWLPPGLHPSRQRAYYTVAALMSTANRSGTGSRTSIGTALGHASAHMSRATTKHQLNRLVRPNPDGPYGDLRGAVRLTESAGVPLDWARLLSELETWYFNGPRTCTTWQQDYFRTISRHDHQERNDDHE